MSDRLSIQFIMISDNIPENQIRFGEGHIKTDEDGKKEDLYESIGNMILADYIEGIITTIFLPEEGEM
jgi:hypothetical protein